MDRLLEFAVLLRGLLSDSAPANRAARHLLHLDIYETYTFAAEHPEALAIAEGGCA